MKISFLVRWLPPNIDGVGDYTWNLASALRRCGIDTRIFTSKEQGLKEVAKNECVFPVINQWQPKAIVKALKTATQEVPDWFCLQYVPQLYGRGCIAWQVPDILGALKKEFKCNVAVTFHEFISGWGIGPKKILLASITRLQTKRILSKIDLAITTCARYKNILNCLSRRPLPVADIPVGSNVEPVFFMPKELAVLRRRNFPEKAKVFGLFSRLSPPRNFPLALRALQKARQQGLDAWLYLIGRVELSNPKLFKKIMHLAGALGVKSYIVTSGQLCKEDLPLHLKTTDIFIFPQSDGVSTRNTALMAALACGLPILSFKPHPGNFNNFYIPCGILADRNDEKGFIQAAVECLKNCDSLSKTAFVNSDYYYKNFSWPVIARKYIEAVGLVK